MLNIEVLRIIAMLTMFIDHVGVVFNIDEFRIIGRVAFPIFGYIFIRNLVEKEVYEKYMQRFLIFGIISQYPFYLVSGSTMLNIMFQFLGSLMFIKSKDLSKWLGFIISLISDYSIFGLIYLFALYQFMRHGQKEHLFLTGLLLNISFFNIFHIIITILTVTFLITHHKNIEFKGRWLPYYIFYLFYPAHLLIIYLFKTYETFLSF